MHRAWCLTLVTLLGGALLFACEESPTGWDGARSCAENAGGPEPRFFENPNLYEIQWGPVTPYFFDHSLTDNGFTVVGSWNAQYVSADGQIWSHRGSPRGGVDYDFAPTGSSDVAVGSLGVSYVYRTPDLWYQGWYPSVGELFAVAHSPDEVVAVGAGGLVVYSPIDDHDYDEVIVDQAEDLRDIVWANNSFTIVDRTGRFWRSDDPTSWEPINVPRLDGVTALAVEGEQMVAVTEDGDLFFLRGENGWKAAFTPACIRNVSFQEGRFCAVGDYGTVLHSPNGRNWAQSKTGSSAHLLAIAVHDGLAIAVGREGAVVRSIDFVHWDPVRLPRPHRLVAAFWTGDEYYVNASGRYAFRTAVGDAWTNESQSSLAALASLAAVEGNRGVVMVGFQGSIRHSLDWNFWTTVASPTQENLSAVVWTRDEYVAAGQHGALVVSVDGVHWSTPAVDTDLSDASFTALLPAGDDGLLAP